MNDFVNDWTPEAFRTPEEILAEEKLWRKLETRLLRMDRPPPAPQPRYYIGEAGICTPGNLTAMSAAVKSGKSSLVGAMIASVLTQNPQEADCFGLRSSNSAGHALLHFDTEQSPYDHFDLMRRALARARRQEPPVWFRSYCLTGLPLHEVRRAVRLALERAVREFGGVHSVLIDGVADLAADVNNPEEANGLVAELQGQAIEFHCPIIGIIHLNPGATEKTRGHLGSQLERKAETNLRLEKIEDVTVLWSDKNRRSPIPKDRGPCFQWSDEKGMHVSVPNTVQTRQARRMRRYRELAEAVFGQTPSLTWKELIDGIQKTDGGSEPMARKKFTAMRDLEVITKAPFGRYTLA